MFSTQGSILEKVHLTWPPYAITSEDIKPNNLPKSYVVVVVVVKYFTTSEKYKGKEQRNEIKVTQC